MHIISDFQDYYDSIVHSVGIDRQCVFNRYQQELNHKELPQPISAWYSQSNDYTKDWIAKTLPLGLEKNLPQNGSIFILAFCGKLYTGWRILYGPEKITCWDSETFNKVKKRMHKQKPIPHIAGIGYSESLFWRNQMKIPEWLDIEPVHSNILNYAFGSPVVAVSVKADGILPFRDGKRNHVIVNPCLQEIGFQSIMDPWTAFQEIHQYVSGVIGSPTRSLVEISDKDMRDAKGFDDWSFKNRGNTKKRKQKK